MTRLFALSLLVLVFAFNACERHPFPGETPITHTHGSDGPSEATEAHGAKAKDEEKKAAHTPAAAREEAPKFFPEKK
jgi:hypothetical protein